MVEMGVSQGDAGNGGLEGRCSLQDRIRRAREVCVHQCKFAVLANQETIEDSKAREAVKVVGFTHRLHSEEPRNQFLGAGGVSLVLETRAIFQGGLFRQRRRVRRRSYRQDEGFRCPWRRVPRRTWSWLA